MDRHMPDAPISALLEMMPMYDETNRKLVRIRLTANGRLFLHHTKEHLQHSLEQKFRSLSQTDQEELVQSLYTLLRILKKMQE